MTPDPVAQAAGEERGRALRALLERQALGPDDTELVLVRRHREVLAGLLRDHLGATLAVTVDGAHLTKQVRLCEARPLPLPARTRAERQRPIDQRRTLGPRAALVLCLVCGVLERRGWTQVPLGALAEEVIVHARALDIDVDWKSRADRLALADAVDLLAGLHAMRLRAGEAGVIDDEDEAFYDVDRRRLALLLADPVRCAEATAPEDLEAPRETGADLAGRARGQRLLRRLVEDPVVYLDELDDDDRAYFLAQRARLERIAGELTGLAVERRREGTVLLGTGRELTDRPFPARGHTKQLALLLLPEICARAGSVLSAPEVGGLVRSLVRRHREHWAWDPADAGDVERAGGEALAVLRDLRLVDIDESTNEVRVLALAHRYRSATPRAAQGTLL
ncbi:MAG: TIGR02678 family protein [Solirubrobacteraceae bacterium]